MDQRIILVLFGFGSLGFGLYKAYLAWSHKRWIDNAKTWPITNGTVTSTQIDYHQQKNRKQYYAVIGYDYTVMDSKHTGSITKDDFWGSEGYAKDICNLHGEGSGIEVHYNPIDPELHVVDFDSVSHNEIFAAVLFTISGLFCLIVLFSGFSGNRLIK